MIAVVVDDLNGYTLEDVAIDYLEQTSLESLDASNVLDSEGIRKITERTETKRVETTKIANSAKRLIGLDDLETRRAMLEYERQESQAEAEQRRQIDIIQATETAEAAEAQAEQAERSRRAQLTAQQKIAIQEINKSREEEIAKKAKEKALVLETEQIEKARALTQIDREREVETQRIRKERELEIEKKAIADVIRERIVVDKTVALEEEEINDVRVERAAARHKKDTLVRAEAEVEKKFVADLKGAEAENEVAKFRAQQRMTEAQAELDAAELKALAKTKLAEGIQAERAAEGLAAVRVADAEAGVIEKRGLAEAKVLRERALAEAEGTRERMLAEAEGNRQTMLATAEGTRERMVAEAEGTRERMVAEAEGTRQTMGAEAEGIERKAEAMRAYDAVTRGHEEFRLALGHERDLANDQLRAQVEIAEHQATAYAKAMEAAEIQIVGGDKGFYENFMRSLSVGHAVDNIASSSKLVRRVLDRFELLEDADDAPSVTPLPVSAGE